MADVLGLIFVVLCPFIYLYTAIKASRFALSKIKNQVKKTFALLGCISIFILLPFTDEIIGQLYFKYICKTQGGTQIYQQIELGEEFFQQDGNPKFITEKGDFYKEALGNKYSVYKQYNMNYIPYLNIARNQYQVKDTETLKILGQHTYFIYFRGWLLNLPGPGLASKSCNSDIGFYQNFLKEIFIKKESGMKQTNQ